ncbi:MAG: succinyldiaminopimelate transaminase [Gammaproteobacteria bacterium]
MNPDLQRLQPYPFQRLGALLDGVAPAAGFSPINLSIGEPQHQPPEFVVETLRGHLDGLRNYPVTRGAGDLRETIANWLESRFSLPHGSLDPERHVLPVNGTREALFAFAQCVVDRSERPLVLMPNPFYQIYEGAALLAGAEPYYLNTTEENRFLPDLESVPEEIWARCQLIYLCSPGNPTGAVAPVSLLKRLIELAERHDFVIASDECYSEIYPDDTAPPPGLLGAAAELGNDDYRRCVVFHSLSKRSNLPGLRSGFVAGDADILQRFLLYRTYHGCAMPPPIQAASRAAWRDEAHVAANRTVYQGKFDAVLEALNGAIEVQRPEAGFYLWPKLPIPDDQFARRLYAEYNVRLLPGRYLSREANGENPGAQRVRIALVAPLDECIEAANRIRRLVVTL